MPGTEDDIRSGERPRRARTPWWARIAIIFGALLMVASGVALVGQKALVARYSRNVPQQDLLGDAKEPEQQEAQGPLNILMVGLDARPGESIAASRADTIIILHVPASRDRAYLISVPRDLMVQVQPYPKSGYAGGRAKMTEAYFHGAQGGAGVKGEVLAHTIKDTLGVTFNAAAIINFSSFEKVIDALGGVDMCVDERVASIHLVRTPAGKVVNIENEKNPAAIGTPIVYEKGTCRRFAAWEALDYSRQRYNLPNGDYDRQRHQQQLLKAILKAATSRGLITNPGKLDRVIQAAGSAFILDTGGVPLADWVFSLRGITTNGLTMLRTNGGKTQTKLVDGIAFELLQPTSQAMFTAVKNDTLDAFIQAHPENVAP
jgi:LCP family protein required for cell wall assembly